MTKIFIKILFQRLAQTWLEQSLTAMQTEDDDAKKEKRTTVCLKAVVVNDICMFPPKIISIYYIFEILLFFSFLFKKPWALILQTG